MRFDSAIATLISSSPGFPPYAVLDSLIGAHVSRDLIKWTGKLNSPAAGHHFWCLASLTIHTKYCSFMIGDRRLVPKVIEGGEGFEGLTSEAWCSSAQGAAGSTGGCEMRPNENVGYIGKSKVRGLPQSWGLKLPRPQSTRWDSIVPFAMADVGSCAV